MLRSIPIQLQGSCVGPINKVLNANNHDFIGNALGPTRQQIHDGTHGVVIYISNTHKIIEKFFSVIMEN